MQVVATPNRAARAASEGGVEGRAPIGWWRRSGRGESFPARTGRPRGSPGGRGLELPDLACSGWWTTLRGLLVGLLFWAPLPLGSNRPWSWTVLAVAVGALLLAWCGAELRQPRLRSLPVPVGLAGVLIGCALGWAWIQTIASPWLAHPVWSWTVAYGLGAAPHPGIDPAAGRAATLRFCESVNNVGPRNSAGSFLCDGDTRRRDGRDAGTFSAGRTLSRIGEGRGSGRPREGGASVALRHPGLGSALPCL
jgi:hypothetical protein